MMDVHVFCYLIIFLGAKMRIAGFAGINFSDFKTRTTAAGTWYAYVRTRAWNAVNSLAMVATTPSCLRERERVLNLAVNRYRSTCKK